MRNKAAWLLAASSFLSILLSTSPLFAISIRSEVLSVGGAMYRSVYSVTNDGSLGSGVAVELFDILFDPTLYSESSLSIVTPASLSADWDQLILASAPGVFPAFDAFALMGGVADGATVSGFAIEYQWFGTGTPGAQPFEVYDPITFALLEQGVTTTKSAQVPEPGTVWLLAMGLASLWSFARAARA